MLILSLLLYALIIMLPGAAVYGLLAPRLSPPLTTMPFLTALGLGLALWPILLLYTTLAHIPAGSIWLYALLLISAAVIYRQRREFRLQRPTLEIILLAVVLLVTLAVRLYFIRDLQAPLYGDSVHHTIVTELIVDHGGIPSDYLPYIPLISYTYHFGFHTQAALLIWADGLDAPLAVLYVGQALNALTVLAAYYLAVGLFAPAQWAKWAGLVSALVTGLISTMPAYYANWGRYTQLAGQAILPFAMVALVVAITPPLVGGAGGGLRPRLPLILLNIILIVGLFLSHYRVLIFYAAWVVAVLIWRLLVAIPARIANAPLVVQGLSAPLPELEGLQPVIAPSHQTMNWGDFVTSLVTMMIIGLGSLLLALPWLLNLISNYFGGLVNRLQNVTEDYLATYNSGTVLSELGQPLPILAVLAILLALVLSIAAWKRVEWRQIHLSALAVALWIGLLYAVANPDKFHLPGAGAVNNFAVGIMLYIPVALLIGYLIGWLLNLLGNLRPLQQRSGLARYALAAAFVVACIALAFAPPTSTQGSGLFTAKDPDPYSVLVKPEDLTAIRWLGQNSAPADKVLIAAVPAKEFAGKAVVGIDGGTWVPTLAKRQVSAPAIVAGGERAQDPHLQDDIYTLDMAAWPLMNKPTLYASTQPNALPTAATYAALKQAGITILYSATGSPFWRLDYINSTPQHFERIYNQDGVQIFRVKY